MTTIKKASMLATVSLLLASSAFAAGGNASTAGIAKSVVHDTNNHAVRNTFDNCVVTKWDSSVNECNDLAKLLNVYFDFNKSTLNAKEKAKLDALAKALKGSKEIASIDIAGYADTIGKNSYNTKLSAKRAANVKAYLAKKGIKARKTSVESFGEDKPVANCDASLAKKELIACLAEDRRVEIKLNTK